MAMEINGNLLDYSVKKQDYSNYASSYANAADNKKKTETENKDSLLSQMDDKYSNFDITEGTFSKNQISTSSKGFQGVMVNTAYST